MNKLMLILVSLGMLTACTAPKPVVPDGQYRVPVNQTIQTTGATP